MHCGYCRDPTHTRRNCAKFKADVATELDAEEEPTLQPPSGEEAHVEPTNGEEANVEQMEQPVHEEEPTVVPNKPKRKRNPSLKVREQQEADKAYEQLRKRAKTYDENGDLDDPTILQVCALYPQLFLNICIYLTSI